MSDPVHASPGNAIIRLEHLHKDFNGTTAVNYLCFSIESGEAFGFIGPNGAGKTTTIKMLSTLLEPTAGDAFIAGHSVTDDPDEVKRTFHASGWANVITNRLLRRE